MPRDRAVLVLAGVLAALTAGAPAAARQGPAGCINSRASVDSASAQGDDHSYGGLPSADGRFVAFSSRATNLAPGLLPGGQEAFRHDRATGETVVVSVRPDGSPSGSGGAAGISDDGRFVAFTSYSDAVHTGDPDGFADAFLRDVASGSTEPRRSSA